jgi:glutathione S-transferase
LIQLLHLPISLYSFKVRLALAAMAVDVPLAEPEGGSYRSPGYRALVPSGTVPALLTPDGVLSESDAIIEYIDETLAESRLMKGSPMRRARIRMLTRLVDLRLEAAVRSLFAHIPVATRDAVEVKKARERIDAALQVIEWALDPIGRFGVDDAVSMADCSIAATSAWLDAMQPEMLPGLAPGPRFSRVSGCLRTELIMAPLIADYRKAVASWVETRLQA